MPRQQMKNDIKSATNFDIDITFEIQKTHPLPTGIEYYKRQLNLYNLGINVGGSGKGILMSALIMKLGQGPKKWNLV